jgi:hypothetical protein
MKIKNLTKKIRLLEARQKKDAKKLAKLKNKLAAAKKKSAARAGKARQSAKSSTGTQKKERPMAAKPKGKVKRKLNLSPERRAQLAAAMKARWAAKRAGAESNPQDTSAGGDFTLGQVPQSS